MNKKTGSFLSTMYCLSNLLDKTSERVKDLPAETVEDLEVFSRLEYVRGLFQEVHQRAVDAAAKAYLTAIFQEFSNNPLLKDYIDKDREADR